AIRRQVRAPVPLRVHVVADTGQMNKKIRFIPHIRGWEIPPHRLAGARKWIGHDVPPGRCVAADLDDFADRAADGKCLQLLGMDHGPESAIGELIAEIEGHSCLPNASAARRRAADYRALRRRWPWPRGYPVSIRGYWSLSAPAPRAGHCTRRVASIYAPLAPC